MLVRRPKGGREKMKGIGTAVAGADIQPFNVSRVHRVVHP